MEGIIFAAFDVVLLVIVLAYIACSQRALERAQKSLERLQRIMAHRDGDEQIGNAIQEATRALASPELTPVARGFITRLHDALVWAAARLDPENQPLTTDELKRMKRRDA